MSVTVNTFPPIQSMNSSRSWALALIVLLHLVFFWALTSGLSTRIVNVLSPTRINIVDLKPEKRVEPIERPVDHKVDQLPVQPLYVPRPENPPVESEETVNLIAKTTDAVTRPDSGQTQTAAPVIEPPMIDSRSPLSEPEYPPAEIRLGHTGRVLLSVYVLENGRIGDVRIEQSSGFPGLDVAAQRATRSWRLKPGTQDGRTVAMWKTIPITFQLKK